MKRLKILFTVLCALCSTMTFAHDFEVDGIYYNITDATNKTVAVTYKGYYSDSSFNEYTGSVIIPENVVYNGKVYSVTSIGGYAFEDCRGLTSIEIPNSITNIGNSAFSGCTALTSITIPNSVTSIGQYAFEGTAWYNNLPDGVVYAGKVLYEYKGTMPSNTSITIKDGTLSITDYAFSGCSGLTSITIPNSVTSIGGWAFSGCSLTSLEIPNSVTSIGDNAFYGTAWYNNQPDGVVYAGNVLYKYKGIMPSNTSVVVKDGTLGIADYAFRDCSGLTSITIPNSVTSIGNAVFEGCSGLTSITIPNSVTSIGEYAFSGCSGLTSIEIPNSVTSIGDEAFSGCSGLTSIVIPNSVTSIGNAVFSGCSRLTSIEIPNSITNIGSSAFSGCWRLTSIEIPNSVTSIGNRAFYGTAWYNNQPDGIVYAGMVLYAHKGSMPENTSVIVKEGTISITDEAFSGCKWLTSIEIPNSVTSIGYRAFSGCKGLTSIEIPNSVTSIGNSAFYDCNGLTNIFVEPGNPKYDSRENSNAIVETESNTLIAGCKTTVIPNNVTSIGFSAFYGCKGLTSITIPNSVTSIGNYAFYDCSNLKTVINLSNLTFSKGSSYYGYVAYYANKVINTPGDDVVGDFVFSTVDGKHTLVAYLGDATDVTLPGDYYCENYAIGDNLFIINKKELTSIEIPNSVTSIGEWAFAGCSGLTRVDIVDGVKSIGLSAFADCNKLEEVYISNTIESIGEMAFSGCTNIFEIWVGSKKAIAGNENIFSEDTYNNALLHVPQGCKFAYERTAPWSRFHIVEMDFTGVEDINEQGTVNNIVYDLRGSVVENPTNGIYIVNGKKVLVK